MSVGDTLWPAHSVTPRECDVCVVGGGPAGALTARQMALTGLSVVLVDKRRFPRDKVCGGCFGRVALDALDAAGLSLAGLGVPSAPLTHVRVFHAHRSATLPLGRRAAVERGAFDYALLDAARGAGVVVFEGLRAAVGLAQAGRRAVTLGDGSAISARLVVVAAGLGGGSVVEGPDALALAPVASRRGAPCLGVPRLGAGAIIDDPQGLYEPGVIHMACAARGEGYVGVARLAPDLPGGPPRIDVAAALDPRGVRERGLAAEAQRILAEAGLPIPAGFASAAWRGTPTLTQRPRRLGAERLLLVGDAAGYVEPFTGEGVGWGLRSAMALASLLDERGLDGRGDLVAAWERAHRAAVGRQQRRCRWVCAVIGARRATPLVVRMLAAAPWLASPVIRSIDGPPGRSGSSRRAIAAAP
ncbi:MAG: NAD(P)/FAD-dependent oxidoreductase [Lacipirellulaceae bacterium]